MLDCPSLLESFNLTSTSLHAGALADASIHVIGSMDICPEAGRIKKLLTFSSLPSQPPQTLNSPLPAPLPTPILLPTAMPQQPTQRARSRIITRTPTPASHESPNPTGLPGRQLSLPRRSHIKQVLQIRQRLPDIQRFDAKSRFEQELDVFVEEEERVFEAEAGHATGKEGVGAQGKLGFFGVCGRCGVGFEEADGVVDRACAASGV